MLDSHTTDFTTLHLGEKKLEWANSSNLSMLDEMQRYVRDAFEPRIKLRNETVTIALNSNCSLIAKDEYNRIKAISFVIPYFFSGFIEVAPHTRSPEHIRDFISRIVITRQVAMLQKMFPCSSIFMVSRATSAAIDTLIDHQWEEFPPDRQLARAQEVPDTQSDSEDIWMRPPPLRN